MNTHISSWPTSLVARIEVLEVWTNFQNSTIVDIFMHYWSAVLACCMYIGIERDYPVPDEDSPHRAGRGSEPPSLKFN